MESETFNVLSAEEYDALVLEHLGIKVEFIADEEAHRGCAYTYYVEEKDAKKFIDGSMIGDLYWPRNALMWMAIEGKVPFGKYLIEVSW